MHRSLLALLLLAGCAAPPPAAVRWRGLAPSLRRAAARPDPLDVAVAEVDSPVVTPTIAMKGARVVSPAEAATWLDEPPVADAPPSDVEDVEDVEDGATRRLLLPPHDPPRAEVRRPAPRVRWLPAPCGGLHPLPPEGWVHPRVECRGRVHVIEERAQGAAAIAFEEWGRLLARVRESWLAPLARDPGPVFVFVYRSATACWLAMPAYTSACYQRAERRVLIGHHRPGEPGGEPRFRAVLRHELAHHLLWEVRADPPRWLSEGISEVFEAAPEEILLDAPESLPLGELLAWSGPNRSGCWRRYAASRTLVAGLLRSRGAAFAKLVTGDRPWPADLRALRAALDARPGDLYAAYRAQRSWRMASPTERTAGRVRAALAPEGARFQPWMLLVGLPGLLLFLAGLGLARPRRVSEPW